VASPDDRRYTREHEWLLVVDTKAKRARVGITDHAQRQLGDVVFVELREVGLALGRGDEFGTVESVKSVSLLYAPTSGKVVAVNQDLNEDPELLNSDPYGDGWMIEVTMSDPAEVGELMTAAEYDEYVRESG
jgi:glycine cleavage system H protein